MMDPFELTADQIEQRLSLPTELSSSDDDRYHLLFSTPPQPAAVLISFLRPFGSHSPWHILFTRRTTEVADHKGQVAFPGGRVEPGDAAPQDTALREAWEEIGLRPCDVQLLGSLDRTQTISNYLVTPVIGAIPWPYPFKLERREVSKVFILPFNWLANPVNYEVRSRLVTFPDVTSPQRLDVYYYKPYSQEVLWGVSAEITLKLISRLLIKHK
jgi:8-oxo-dGTP pyrophosphatase MutT (NUDIX family)